jgi:hypothetical protein
MPNTSDSLFRFPFPYFRRKTNHITAVVPAIATAAPPIAIPATAPVDTPPLELLFPDVCDAVAAALAPVPLTALVVLDVFEAFAPAVCNAPAAVVLATFAPGIAEGGSVPQVLAHSDILPGLAVVQSMKVCWQMK